MSRQTDDPNQHADLIGYHLGLCDEADAKAIEHAWGTGDSLIQARAKLSRLLTPLDRDDIPEPPANLVEGILARVAQSQQTLPFRPLSSAMEEGATRDTSFISMRELLSLAAVIAIFVGIFVPGYRTARINSEQAICANNLREVGTGLASYNEQYNFPMPAVGNVFSQGASWAPTDQPGTPRYRNSQNTFTLVRFNFVPSRAFNCPGRESDKPMSLAGHEQYDDFPDPLNNSYSSQLVTQQFNQESFLPNAPTVSDLTPLLNDQRILNTNGPIPINSTSHRGLGQNVLTRDGRVIFSKTPLVGIDNDDIYRVIGVQRYTGMERPQLRSDAFLVP
ncbi:MAG: hypothetical protein AABZ08_11365 [Planctomycetota bacterium]